METETIFRIALPALIFTFVVHRGYHTRKHGREENTLKNERGAGSRNWPGPRPDQFFCHDYLRHQPRLADAGILALYTYPKGTL